MFSFDPYSPAVDADPFPYYKTLRDEHPCFWSKDANMWVLSRHADILAALSNWQTYSSARGNLMDELPGRAGATLGTTDPPRHDRLRNLVQHAFTRRGLEALTDPIRGLVKETLDEIGDAKPTSPPRSPPRFCSARSACRRATISRCVSAPS
jgi:cytochrome P450